MDADALVAGAFSTTGASHLILRLGELSILNCIAPLQVQEEAERNLRYKLPDALPSFRAIIQRALHSVPNPSAETMAQFLSHAHPEDVPILASAVLNDCHYLVTFNTRHYHPASEIPLVVVTPGRFLQHLRQAISRLAQTRTEK